MAKPKDAFDELVEQDEIPLGGGGPTLKIAENGETAIVQGKRGIFLTARQARLLRDVLYVRLP